MAIHVVWSFACASNEILCSLLLKPDLLATNANHSSLMNPWNLTNNFSRLINPPLGSPDLYPQKSVIVKVCLNWVICPWNSLLMCGSRLMDSPQLNRTFPLSSSTQWIPMVQLLPPRNMANSRVDLRVKRHPVQSLSVKAVIIMHGSCISNLILRSSHLPQVRTPH